MARTLTPESRLNADRAQFMIDLAAIKARAGQLGFYRTLQALDGATHMAGFEWADIRTGKQADVASRERGGG